MNRLSITGTCLLASLCMLTTACNSEENEQMYTEKIQTANAQLRSAITQLKQGIKEADTTAPSALGERVAAKEAELKAVLDEEAAILSENKALAEELDLCNAKLSELKGATTTLETQFEKERAAANKAKLKYNRSHEHLQK